MSTARFTISICTLGASPMKLRARVLSTLRPLPHEQCKICHLYSHPGRFSYNTAGKYAFGPQNATNDGDKWLKMCIRSFFCCTCGIFFFREPKKRNGQKKTPRRSRKTSKPGNPLVGWNWGKPRSEMDSEPSKQSGTQRTPCQARR